MSSISVSVPRHLRNGSWLDEISNLGTAMKRKVYVKDARQVPRYAIIRRGKDGGLYYETEEQQRAKDKAEGRKPAVQAENTGKYRGEEVEITEVREGRGGGVKIKYQGREIWVRHEEIERGRIPKVPEKPAAPPKPPTPPPEPKVPEKDPRDISGQQFLYNGEVITITGPTGQGWGGDMVRFRSKSSQGMIRRASLKPYDPDAEAKLIPKNPKDLARLGKDIKENWKKSHKKRGSRWGGDSWEVKGEAEDRLDEIARSLEGVPPDQKLPLLIKNTVGAFKVVSVQKDQNKIYAYLKLSDSKKSYELSRLLDKAGIKNGTFKSTTRGLSFSLDTVDFDTINAFSRMKVEGAEKLNGKKFTADRKTHNAIKKLSPEMQETTMKTLRSVSDDLDKWGVEDIGVGFGAGSGALGLAFDGAGTILLSSTQFKAGRLNRYTNEQMNEELTNVEAHMRKDYGLQQKPEAIKDGSYLRNRASWGLMGSMRVQTQAVLAHELGHQIHFKIMDDHPGIAQEFADLEDYADITEYAHKKPKSRHGKHGRQPIEPFAECYALYKTSPKYLKAASPKTYAFMQKHFKEGS